MTLPVALSLVLAFLAAAHAWWAMGRIWPASSEPDLARAVIGDGRVLVTLRTVANYYYRLLGQIAAQGEELERALQSMARA